MSGTIALGRDVSTFDGADQDLDVTFKWVFGRRALAEVILRGWIAEPGTIVYAPDRGVGVLSLYSKGLKPGDFTDLKIRLEHDARKDERVGFIDVTVKWIAQAEKLRIHGYVVDEDGPFELVVDVDKVGARIIQGP